MDKHILSTYNDNRSRDPSLSISLFLSAMFSQLKCLSISDLKNSLTVAFDKPPNSYERGFELS